MSIYLSSAYLAPVQYYTKFLQTDTVFIEQNEYYVKQSYRSRCAILTANGAIFLSIPIEHTSGEKKAFKDIRIADHANWQHLHWNAIISAYNSSPFFEYYQDDFYPFYHRKFDFLFDFNEQLRLLILDLLNIDSPSVHYTTSYKFELDNDVLDLRNAIHPKTKYQSEDKNFQAYPYYQVFGDRYGFTANLSIIDLLFNMGNESLIVLQSSII